MMKQATLFSIMVLTISALLVPIGWSNNAAALAAHNAQPQLQVATATPTTTPVDEDLTALVDDVSVELELVVDGLTAPLHLEAPPDESGRRFIVEQTGLIWVLTPDGELLDEPFLDISDRIVELSEGFEERGLLGFAFHPNFAENDRFYVYYSAPLGEEGPDDWDHVSRVSEFKASEENPDQANPDTERVLLEVPQPNPKTNAGALAFGPDGYLYVAVGEGGGAHGVGEIIYGALEVPEELNVWDEQAQDIHNLLGSILRINVDQGWPGYAVPQNNPFVDRLGEDEIYAWGFRNPYRMSFDQGGNHELFVAAVGETLWETIYLVDQPGNYGWPIKEGTHCFDRQQPFNPPESCPDTGPHGWRIIDPIIEYGNLNLLQEESQVEAEPAGSAVIGVHVYRGDAIPELYGKLVFGDFSADPQQPTGQLLVAQPPDTIGALWPWQQLLTVDAWARSLGQDAEGELYLLTSQEIGPVGDTGAVWKLVPAPEEEAGLPPVDTWPAQYTLPGEEVFPEGIALDPSTGDFFVSSTTDGAIYRGTVGEEETEVFLPGGEDGRTSAAGLALGPEGLLYVAGAGTGNLYVYDAENGDLLANFNSGQEETFVNDVAVTPLGNAYFTDSFAPFIYRVSRNDAGDWEFGNWLNLNDTPIEYQEGFNLNGIVATEDGRYLIVVQSNTGNLYRIDLSTQEVSQIDVGGTTFPNGDGLVLDGQTLYVIQNQQEEIREVRLSEDFASGEVVSTITDPSFAYPTTAAEIQEQLLVVNSQFDERGQEPELPFTVSRVSLP